MTLVVVLTWITAILSLIAGGILLFASDDVLREAGVGRSTATTVGLVQIIVGLVTILVARGLRHGNNFSRFLVSVLMILRIALGLWEVIRMPSGTVTGLTAIGFSAVILALLWNNRANVFFASK